METGVNRRAFAAALPLTGFWKGGVKILLSVLLVRYQKVGEQWHDGRRRTNQSSEGSTLSLRITAEPFVGRRPRRRCSSCYCRTVVDEVGRLHGPPAQFGV